MREIALTFDDLPFVDAPADVEGQRRLTRALLDALVAGKAPATAFVNENRLYVPGEVEARIGLLEMWLQAGVRQVLLVHANRINADALPGLLRHLRARGYTFVSLERALEDPAYARPDPCVGPMGLSWLHRWGLGSGRPLRIREEPDPPEWIRALYGGS